jgi:hypothetical protein
MKYDSETIRKVFSFTITELKKYNVADMHTISKILPNIYKGLTDGQLKVRISSVVTLEFDFQQKEEKDKDLDAINSFGKEMWR